MSMEAIGLIGILLTFLLIFMKVWAGVAMAMVGMVGIAYLAGWDTAFNLIGSDSYTRIGNNVLSAIPLFVLMGTTISYSGLGEDLFYSASKWLGRVRGGLAMASTVACGIFAAVSGSSTATALTMGKVAYPEMKKYKYDDRIAVGCLAAGGTIGSLIPPSMPFILYGMITGNSIGKLFIAGIIPGILEVLFYLVTIYIVARLKPHWMPMISEKVIPLREKIVSLNKTWPIALLIVLVIGGLYRGVFTPTEAGAVGSVGIIVISFIARRLNWSNLRGSLFETARTTAMIVLMLAGVNILVRFLTLSNVPVAISDFVIGLNLPPLGLIIFLALFYLILGCFLDVMAAIILTLPIIYPTVIAAGLDPIWFGVLVVRFGEIGVISPPFGIISFIMSSTLNLPVGTVFRGVIPFLIADFFHIALLIAVPALALFLVY